MALSSTLPLLLAVLFQQALTDPLADDVNYMSLFTADAERKAVHDVAITMSGEPIPNWVDGSLFLGGPGLWEVGGQKMTHMGDGFMKMNKWKFSGGKVYFSSKLITSGSLNKSIHDNDLCWGVYAQETDPPRKNPGLIGFIKAPNDNNNVNNWLHGDDLILLSDSPTLVIVDAETLAFKRTIEQQALKNLTNPLSDMAFINSGGSAHPWCGDDGSMISLREAIHPTSMGKGYMSVYKIHPDKPDVVQDIVGVSVPRSSYTHSWGMTKGMENGDHAVVVAQPVYTNIEKIMQYATLKEGFEEPSGANTVIHILPMDNSHGTQKLEIQHEAFFFGHFINTFSPKPGKITFDIDYQADIFFDRFSFDIQSDKTKRDNWANEHNDAFSTPTRFEVDIATGTITSETKLFSNLEQCGSKKWCEMDLFKLHPDDYGRDYCGYWAWHNYWNSTSFGSWAIVRVDLCASGGPKVAAHWYQRNAYPGEPQFVPKPGATDKTEGVIIFKTLEGDTGLSKIVVADAKTLKTISTGILPVHIPFTIHGDFYPSSQKGSKCPQRNMERLAQYV